MDEIECPYCGAEIETEMDGNTEYDEECPECGKTFEISVDFDPRFTCSKIELTKCAECGREIRTSESFKHAYPYPKKYADDKQDLCQTCFYKLIALDDEQLGA